MVVMALFCFGGEKLVNEGKIICPTKMSAGQVLDVYSPVLRPYGLTRKIEYQPRGVPTLKAHDHT